MFPIIFIEYIFIFFYCITVGSSCKENNIFNNGDSQLYTLDESGSSGGGSGDNNNNNDGELPEDFTISGYNLIVIISFIIFVCILFALKTNYKFQ